MKPAPPVTSTRMRRSSRRRGTGSSSAGVRRVVPWPRWCRPGARSPRSTTDPFVTPAPNGSVVSGAASTSPYSPVVTRLRNVAIVLAGGTGARVGLSIPKQLVKVAGKPIIEHTIGLLNASPLIDEVVVLMTPGHLDAVHDIL